MGQLPFLGAGVNKSGAPSPPVRPTGGLCHSCPSSLWGSFPGAVLIGLCHLRGDLAMGISSFQILTLQLLPLSMSGAGFLFPFFRPAGLPHFLVGGQGSPCSTSGHLCVVIMYRGPGRPRVGVLALSSLLWFSFHNVLALVYLRGHALEQEMSPPSPPAILLVLFPLHLPSSMFSGLSCFVSPGPPPVTLFPLQPLSG